MERVPCLKGHSGFPSSFCKQLADFSRRLHILTEVGVLRLRKRLEFTADEVRLVGVMLDDHIPTGMVCPFGAINRLDVSRLVPLVDVRDGHFADDVALRASQRDFLASGERSRLFRIHRERNRNCPGVLAVVRLDHLLIENAVPGGRVHRPGQRAERSVSNTVNRRQVCGRDRDFCQRLTGCQKGVHFVGTNRAADRFR